MTVPAPPLLRPKAQAALPPLARNGAEEAVPEATSGMPRFLGTVKPRCKLDVGPSDDPLEHEADEFAQAVTQHRAVSPRFLALARASPHGSESAERENVDGRANAPPEVATMRRQPLDGNPPDDRSDESRGRSRSARGARALDRVEPLAAPVRAPLEHTLGVELGSVRVHSGVRAAAAARQLHARAFAQGHDIWLGAGQRRDDLGLLAHEVAHVVQHNDGSGPIRRQDEGSTSSGGDAAGNTRQSFGFSEEEMEARLAATPAEGADTSAPTVELAAATESTLDEVEAEPAEAEGDGGPPAEAGGEDTGIPGEGAARGERRAAGGAGGPGAERPAPPDLPGPASEFEALVGADVAAYLDGNLSDERLAGLEPQTRMLLEAADLLGERSITDPEAAALAGLGGEALPAGAPTTGYENEPAWLRTVATIRDVTGQLGGIVGIIGLVATVSGFILSLLIPPVGAFLLTVGRFCDVAALILDAISLVLGVLLTGYNYYRLKNETDPEERRRLLGMVRQDAMGTVMSAVAVATAVAPGAGRALGRGGRRLSAGLRTASRASGAIGRGARAVRSVGLAGRLAARAGRRGIGSAGRAAATGFRRLSRSSSLAGRAARGLRAGHVAGLRALGRARRATGRTLSRAGVWARGTAPVRWANRLGGQAEEWTRMRLRGLAASDTAMGRFYNRRLRGIHERNVMLARSLNDPVERAYQLRLGQQLSDELDALRQANPGWTPRQLEDALRSRFGRERLGDAQVGTSRGGNVQFVRDDASFLRQVRETEFTEIQLIRDRLPPGATPRELAEAVNSSPFIKGRWTEEELRAFTAMRPTRGAAGELALRNAAGEALAVSKTGHHTLPASMAPQISRNPRFIQIVNDSRSYRDFIDRAHPGMTHVPPVEGYRVPGRRAGTTRQANDRREVIENMLDQGQIPGYTRADIDYFMGRGLADDLVVDGSSGVWRNRRVAGNQMFFNPHLGIGHEWNWANEVARQVFDMDTRLGLSLRRELGSQLALPAVRQATRTTGGERGGDAAQPAASAGTGGADGRLSALIDAAIRARTAREQGLSAEAAIDALLTPLPADQSLAPADTAAELPPELAEPMPVMATAVDEGATEAISAEGTAAGPEEAPAAPPSPVPYSPQALVSIREQRIAVAEAIGVVGQYIADADAAEAHNRAAQDAAAELASRNVEQQQFAQAERDTVAGEQDKLTQAGSAQENMAAENERAAGEAERGQGEAESVQGEGREVSVEPKPEEPRERSWLERAWDATAGALWDNLVAPAVRAVRRKVNQVMESINEFIMNMINQALGLDEIEAELNAGGEDIGDRRGSLDETDAGLQETQEQASAEQARNQQTMEQAEANAGDAAASREDAEALRTELQAQDQALLAEEMQGTSYILDFGARFQPYFTAEAAGAAVTEAGVEAGNDGEAGLATENEPAAETEPEPAALAEQEETA
ncbi:DUF4157 domain-containing protein [Thauera sp.]|uniref:eCIS core domain-containing protein n=1 Tax=Thauera sp. TaxID=1905334 RepID=UPI002B77DB83|nr:DUF4157 domain-containing protein [Thauera sp.]HRP24365.1 DUF4157 domain-containing protein [Thauera sp.]